MNGLPAVPEGFRVERGRHGLLIAAAADLDALQQAGLDAPAGWLRGLEAPGPRQGRGAAGRLQLPGGRWLFVKQMRRGGLAAALWRGRFAGTRRLIDNLQIPLEAVRRGLRTPMPVAMLLVGGPPGLYRAWIGFEEVPDASSLLELLGESSPPDRECLAAAVGLVRRMHDAGIEHRDLNLGNLLVARAGESRRMWIVDLDRARLHDGPLAFGRRLCGLQRLERSHVKNLGPRADPAARRAWYELYAAGDAALLERLTRGRGRGRVGSWLRGPGRG